ncbi:MAG TPA: malate synthase A [Gemmatimonadales bacterium]|nr:malate synthase A [Gemmatimonadales bacterium]
MLPPAPVTTAQDRVLTPPAIAFVETLVRRFRPRLAALLDARTERQRRLDAGSERLDFLAETADIRASDWRVGSIPADLLDRRVEITGPVDRKMIINALNSGAQVFMADFEDSLAPTWQNVIAGQANLMDAVRRTIQLRDSASGKEYRLADRTALLLVRPRGLHLVEKHLQVDGAPATAALVDFGLYLFHNAGELRARGTGPYFYLPKLQSHHEARWWDDVISFAEQSLGLPPGTVKVTVLIETLPAAFEMDEILHDLRNHIVGLNCGRWDYIFSTIKTLKADASHVLPDRAQVTMTAPCMRAYTTLLVKTCHRRGAFAMGGMAAQIPIKGDPARNEAALAKVREDKRREAADGHDGTWVAHPALVPLALEEFARALGEHRNQLHVSRADVRVTARDLLEVPVGDRTEAGLRHNIKVGVQYLEAWLDGNGCVPLYDLMEDAATAEICRSQVWQWLHRGVDLLRSDGSTARLTEPLFLQFVGEEMTAIEREIGADRFTRGRYAEARRLFIHLSTATEFVEFLTLPAYDLLDTTSSPGAS